MVTTNNMLLSYKEEAICYVFKEKKNGSDVDDNEAEG